MTLFVETDAVIRNDPSSFCDGAKERTEEAVKRLGLKMGDIATMRDTLETLGVSDTVFTLSYVVKQSQSEARTVLLQYMQYQLDIVKSLLPVLSVSKYSDHMRAVEKRTLGRGHSVPLTEAQRVFNRLWHEELHIPSKYALGALVTLSNADVSDNIAACHAGIALMDAGRTAGRGEQVREQLESKLRELIPISPQDRWNRENTL